MAELFKRLCLDLPDALTGQAKNLSHLFERVVVSAADPEPHAQDTLLAGSELGQRFAHVPHQIARLERRMRVDAVRRRNQLAQGGVAFLSDREVERDRLLHHRQHLLDALDRRSSARGDLAGGWLLATLLREPAPLPQNASG